MESSFKLLICPPPIPQIQKISLDSGKNCSGKCPSLEHVKYSLIKSGFGSEKDFLKCILESVYYFWTIFGRGGDARVEIKFNLKSLKI